MTKVMGKTLHCLVCSHDQFKVKTAYQRMAMQLHQARVDLAICQQCGYAHMFYEDSGLE